MKAYKDADSDIYMNTEDVLRISNQDEAPEIHQDSTTLNPASQGKKCFPGYPGAVFLWLLCGFMLALSIGLWIKYSMLQSSYNQVTLARDILQSSYNQLEKNYNNLTFETNSLKEEREILKEWIKFKFSWYFVSDTIKNWFESRQDCKSREADLVIINSREEQIFVSGHGKNLWIGLTDHDFEGRWTWVDNTPLISGYWRSGEPNNVMYGLSDEDCAHVVADSNHGDKIYSWNDASCSQTMYWICKRSNWLNPE